MWRKPDSDGNRSHLREIDTCSAQQTNASMLTHVNHSSAGRVSGATESTSFFDSYVVALATDVQIATRLPVFVCLPCINT